MLSLIVCLDSENGMSKNGDIPWNISEDKKYFKNVTSEKGPNALIMGKNTFETMPRKIFSKNRHAYIISNTLKSEDFNEESYIFVYNNINELLSSLNTTEYNKVFCIGGRDLYLQCVKQKMVNEIYITKLNESFDCDKFLNLTLEDFYLVEEKKENFGSFCFYKKKKEHQEIRYLNLMKSILFTGNHRQDRTSTGTISKFGKYLTFDISSEFPLLTTKKVYHKGVIEELIWFLKGDTNVNNLIDKNVHIWDGNSTREYMDSIGISREERDIGPCYGWQWRHFGGSYTSMNEDYTNCGFDQLKYIIDEINENKFSRRIVMSAWNPPDLKEMNLPPCHVMYQFYVENEKLSCQMYQRSADVFLGLPFNIASSALLCYIIANICQLKPGNLSICIGDAHIYKNHVKQCIEQLEKVPLKWCSLVIEKELSFNDLNNFDSKWIKINEYTSHGTIKAPMAI
tara:strand:+ start:11253 stop:12617 length:1365 start_codon:yes stop_codon:yes gene_type:complete